MKLNEMWEAMRPYTNRMYGEWLTMSNTDLIYKEAFKIAFWREVEWFMTLEDTDDCNDDVEGLDEVDPKFFFDQLKSAPVDDDHAAEIFICDYSTNFEYFTGLVNQIIKDWREQHGKAEEKD